MKRELPPPTREPKDGRCEHCKQQHPVLEWDGLSWYCPRCFAEAEENAAYHAFTGDWR